MKVSALTILLMLKKYILNEKITLIKVLPKGVPISRGTHTCFGYQTPDEESGS